MLIADTRDPGFSHSPIHTLNDGATHMSYYQDVRVPVEMVVGKENEGWKLITLQLNHERVGLAAFSGHGETLLEETIEWARKTEAEDGNPVAAKPWVQATLGEAYSRVQAMKMMNWRMAWAMQDGDPSPALSSSAKVFGTEQLIEIYRLLLEVLGCPGLVHGKSPGAQLAGEVEHEWRGCQINTFGGGVNEVQREIIAMMGLGLPRAPR